MRDPYRILGLTPKAGAEDIKRAYRRLARELHPDTAKGDALAEDTFKDITAAYNLLSDPDQRAAFDRGDIDANGQKIRRGPQGGGRPGARPGGRKGPFDRFFRDKGASGHGASPVTVNGANVTYTLTVSFMEATRGCTKRINVATGKTLDVRLPPGTRDGQTLRLKGQGMRGMGGGTDGDALVEITVTPDSFFRTKGDDIEVDMDISLPEAVLGAKVMAPTVDGPVNVSIPAGANSGTRLRLRGKGLNKGKDADGTPQRGDQYVVLRVVLPKDADKDLTAFVTKWAKKNAYEVR